MSGLPEPVRVLFRGLAHGGAPVHAAGALVQCGEAGQPSLGTQVRFHLIGPPPLRVRFQAYGCPYTLAVCEWLAGRLEALSGQQPALDGAQLAAGLGGPEQWAHALGVPAERLGRLLIVEDALGAALAARAVGP